MMNKMGSWNMLVDYGFKGVSDYLFNYELSTLQFIMSEVDLNNASRFLSPRTPRKKRAQPRKKAEKPRRYYESYIARCIADTTLKKTFMAMKRAESATEAVFDATRYAHVRTHACAWVRANIFANILEKGRFRTRRST
jgi:hypothetical protein